MRPDGCTCGTRGPDDGSHLPGCPVVPFRRPEPAGPEPFVALTVCDVCNALFLGTGWCHDQRDPLTTSADLRCTWAEPSPRRSTVALICASQPVIAWWFDAWGHRVARCRKHFRESAAIAYALVSEFPGDPKVADRTLLAWWPWGPEAWKPADDRLRNLVKAGALIAAAIDVELLQGLPDVIDPGEEFEARFETASDGGEL